MRIRLLGTAAGGGVPQWNCNCRVCRQARARTGRVHPRTQSSVAVSADGRKWFLLNASPDIRSQIESSPLLAPSRGKPRSSPIQAVLLTNADLDHTLGLLMLREGERLRIHAAPAVRRSLSLAAPFSEVLNHFCGVEWIRPPVRLSPLPLRDGSGSGLFYQRIPLPGKPPRFARRRTADSDGHVSGFFLKDEKTGGRLLFLPDVGEISPGLRKILPQCDALLFDGTFWAEDEMIQTGAGSLPASRMGHLPVGGPAGSLRVLAGLSVKHKIYLHINNTNPMLLENSRAHAAVKAAGCLVGRDGMELNL